MTTAKATAEDYSISIPEVEKQVDQHEEWLLVKFDDGREEKIRFHDYGRIYDIPGLYEKLFYDTLKCQSPTVLADMLQKEVEAAEEKMSDLRVFDFGAGNGMVAEALHERGVEFQVGADLLEEAKVAALRDRPDVYDDYLVCDMGNPTKEEAVFLKEQDFNAMITVAALGFDDIPPKAFLKAFNVVENGGWICFNIRDKFVDDTDDSGYGKAITWLSEEYFEVKARKKYTHRLDITGEELKYIGFVGRKKNDIPESHNY